MKKNDEALCEFKKIVKFSGNFTIRFPLNIWQKYLGKDIFLDDNPILIFEFYSKNLFLWRCSLLKEDAYKFDSINNINKNLKDYPYKISNFLELSQDIENAIKLVILFDFLGEEILNLPNYYPLYGINNPWRM